MPTTPALSDFAIHNLATPQSFERGWDYYRSGAVRHIGRQGNTLLGEVEGSHYQPYEVTVELDAEGHQMIRVAVERMGLTARAYHRVLKISRTIPTWRMSHTFASSTWPKPCSIVRAPCLYEGLNHP